MSATSCYRHPQVSATRSCGECFQPICAGCSVIDGEKCRCPDCAAQHRQGKKRQTVLVAALGVLGVAAAGAYVAWRSHGPAPSEPSFDYGPRSAQITAMRHQLEKEPCDRSKAVQFAQALFAAEDWRGSVVYADDFVARCGPFPQLRSVSYSAHMRLSEFDLALKDATELVDSAPNNAGYRVWRALAHQSRGASEQALTDLQEAFRLKPEEFQVANQLAATYERLRQPCEAYRVLLEHQRLNKDSAARPDVRDRVELLYAEGRCGAIGGGEAPARAPGKR